MAEKEETKVAAKPAKVEREKPTGGRTPHDGSHYQDQWPANPPPSEAAAEKAKLDEEQYKELHG